MMQSRERRSRVHRLLEYLDALDRKSESPLGPNPELAVTKDMNGVPGVGLRGVKRGLPYF
jgi:hypothetical protein